LADIDYRIACGGYDASALGLIPGADHGRCSGLHRSAI